MPIFAELQNSRFDGSFIAGIAELRYLYSMPVERIVKYFQGNGFDLDMQTAHGLLKKTAELFDNLYRAMQLAVREGSYLNLAVLAYWVVSTTKYRLKQKGIKVRWEELLRIMSTQQRVTMVARVQAGRNPDGTGHPRPPGLLDKICVAPGTTSRKRPTFKIRRLAHC